MTCLKSAVSSAKQAADGLRAVSCVSVDASSSYDVLGRGDLICVPDSQRTGQQV